MESLFPPVPSKSCSQIPLTFNVWFCRNSSSHCRPPVRKPDVGLRIFTPVSGLLWYKCSPVCESPTQQLWDWILLWSCPSYHLIVASPLSLDVGYHFWWVPVSSCWWLFSSELWFQCSHQREWEHFLLLCYLEPISQYRGVLHAQPFSVLPSSTSIEGGSLSIITYVNSDNQQLTRKILLHSEVSKLCKPNSMVDYKS